MQVFKTINEINTKLLDLKTKTVALVPTMGNLHEGHISLVEEAKKTCDYIITSIFINPTQFSVGEDFSKYPRTYDEDIKKLSGTDAVFYPDVLELFPENSNLFINESKISKVLCGKFRENHFSGVLTIVNKLFNIIKPDYAFFGEKDFQQLALINLMNENLNMGVKIIGCPIVRDKNGLALSSRNNYFDADSLKKASIIYKTLLKVKELFINGETNIINLKNYALECLCNNFNVQYIEILNTKTFTSVKFAKKGDRLFVCAYLAKIRLIDNLEL